MDTYIYEVGLMTVDLTVYQVFLRICCQYLLACFPHTTCSLYPIAYLSMLQLFTLKLETMSRVVGTSAPRGYQPVEAGCLCETEKRMKMG